MHLAEAEFWRLTPRKLDALLARQRADLHREEVLLGLVRRDLINFSMARPKDPVTLEDLVPPMVEPSLPAPARRRLTKKHREEIANSFRRMFAGMEK